MDIDIDFKTQFDPLDYFDQAVRASMVKNGKLVKHPVGIYLQQIPKDVFTELSAIPYKEAEEKGYFKMDFLHLTLLNHFNNKDEIRTLINVEPDWSLLQDKEIVKKLFQLHRHYNVLRKIKPRTVEELADTIALIRPSKKYLIDQYIIDKESIRQELYQIPLPKGCFKKSHAISYSLTIVLQLHLIKGGII